MRSAVLAGLVLLAGCQSIPDRLLALGTEPFWSVKPASGALFYSTPEMPKGIWFSGKRTFDGNDVVWTGTYAGAPFILRVSPGKCNDGMSDTVYPFTAELTVSGQTERGCARPD